LWKSDVGPKIIKESNGSPIEEKKMKPREMIEIKTSNLVWALKRRKDLDM
jgi:hypothetical protein